MVETNDWIGYTLRGTSLLRAVLKGRTERKKAPVTPGNLMLDWMTDT